jgi:hypothetical protein
VVPSRPNGLTITRRDPTCHGSYKATRKLLEATEAFERVKSRILRDLEERRWWIAPIRKIPTEILTEVFLLASETEGLAPLKLAGVCHLWREIMFATPRA